MKKTIFLTLALSLTGCSVLFSTDDIRDRDGGVTADAGGDGATDAGVDGMMADGSTEDTSTDANAEDVGPCMPPEFTGAEVIPNGPEAELSVHFAEEASCNGQFPLAAGDEDLGMASFSTGDTEASVLFRRITLTEGEVVISSGEQTITTLGPTIEYATPVGDQDVIVVPWRGSLDIANDGTAVLIYDSDGSYVLGENELHVGRWELDGSVQRITGETEDYLTARISSDGNLIMYVDRGTGTYFAHYTGDDGTTTDSAMPPDSPTYYLELMPDGSPTRDYLILSTLEDEGFPTSYENGFRNAGMIVFGSDGSFSGQRLRRYWNVGTSFTERSAMGAVPTFTAQSVECGRPSGETLVRRVDACRVDQFDQNALPLSRGDSGCIGYFVGSCRDGSFGTPGFYRVNLDGGPPVALSFAGMEVDALLDATSNGETFLVRDEEFTTMEQADVYLLMPGSSTVIQLNLNQAGEAIPATMGGRDLAAISPNGIWATYALFAERPGMGFDSNFIHVARVKIR